MRVAFLRQCGFAAALLGACATAEGIDAGGSARPGATGGGGGQGAEGGSNGGTGGGTGGTVGGAGGTGGNATGGTSTGGTSSDSSAGAGGAGTGGAQQEAGSDVTAGGSSGDAAAGSSGCEGGAVEVCNGTDDDADGLVDEPSTQNTTACNGCTAIQRDGFAYWFCTTGRDWGPARDNCVSKGGQLASIHDVAENDFVTSTMVGLGVSGRFWFGLNDRSSEGVYAWLDGSVVDFTYFNCSTTASLSTGAEDCGNIIASSKCWDDDDCSGHSFAYVCKAPHADGCP